MKKGKIREFLILILLLLVLLLLVLFLFVERQIRQNKALQLIYIPKVVDVENDFWTTLIQGAEMAAREYDVSLEILENAREDDVEGQNRLIEEAIEKKPDALILSPISFTESTELLKQAKERGIHIVFIDTYVDEEVQDLTVATDNLELGRRLGEYTKEFVTEDAQIVIVGSVKGTSTAMEREEGFLQGLGEKAGNVLEVVFSDSDYEKAYSLTEELMVKYPELKIIVGLNEYSSVGAARAVKAAGAQDRILFVGVDSSREAIELMEQGIFKAVVIQKSFKMGYVGIRETVKMLRGERVEKNIDSGCELITPDNMYDSENEKLLFPFGSLKKG